LRCSVSWKRSIIRLQAHLVGPRAWDAYSKAKYLWELQYKELMSLDRIVAFCGGNKRDVTIAISAYSDMENYYRPICDADDYDTEKYSGFVELQNTKVKDAILKAGFDLTNFAQWIRKGNIRNLEQVRKLPRVLSSRRIAGVAPHADEPMGQLPLWLQAMTPDELERKRARLERHIADLKDELKEAKAALDTLPRRKRGRPAGYRSQKESTNHNYSAARRVMTAIQRYEIAQRKLNRPIKVPARKMDEFIIVACKAFPRAKPERVRTVVNINRKGGEDKRFAGGMVKRLIAP
jgi:hypothetical protein